MGLFDYFVISETEESNFYRNLERMSEWGLRTSKRIMKKIKFV
jgi:hypothetical protein